MTPLATLPAGARFRIPALERTGTVLTIGRGSVTVRYDAPPTIRTFTDRWGEVHEIVSDTRPVAIAPATAVERLDGAK